MRVNKKWHNAKDRGIDEQGNTLAFTLWKIVNNAVNELGDDGFDFGDGEDSSSQQQLEVLTEFMIFSIQLLDRLAYMQEMGDEQRAELITTVTKHAIKTMSGVARDWDYLEQYQEGLIDKINSRFNDYSEFKTLSEDEPISYSAGRYFATLVAKIMTGKMNYGIEERIADVYARELVTEIKKATRNFL